ncbi:MAG: hypothetical protein A2V64_05970 [Bacteroidetes bacterium RBG_13_43_22]|nr:MAG: hypothetical protein A2V64_05970 [Bacteroidetes bacterium RBG_13_43_22]
MEKKVFRKNPVTSTNITIMILILKKLILMKKIFPVLVLLVLCVSAVSAQSANGKKDPVGKWKFDAPYAPEGYTSGTIDIGFAEEKYSAAMAFNDIGYSFTGEKVIVRNDSLLFMIWIESTDVNVGLKIEDKTKMTGNAVYYEGTVPLTLTKEPENK